MELNREKIVKALEYCNTAERCLDCPYRDNECVTLYPDALALIKELTEENERLRAELEQRPPKLIITKLLKKENANV